ncbi:hypothetical protein IWW50_004133 [Coemansia erecta]|nr:hypothetical protein GGF43_003308 [Coemansia sp. RSA 2618]KAJ2822620.1 hypothetical protein IWW50_004133 [Coemansia erecta]
MTRAGYAVHQELATGNGRADVLVYPGPGFSDFPQNTSAYYIFELKRYEGPTKDTNAARMTDIHRREAAAFAWGQTIGAQRQIQQRYLADISERAHMCAQIYVVGITFWVNRFCMLVHKLKKRELADGEIEWVFDPYPGNQDGRIEGLRYDDLDDELHAVETGGVRISFKRGHLVVFTI